MEKQRGKLIRSLLHVLEDLEDSAALMAGPFRVSCGGDFLLHYGHLVRILHCCTSQTMTEALSSMDLTSAQGHLMGFLAHCENPPCARDIEEAFHLSHPTVSGLLSRLEKKEFLELRPDPEDRRCKRIYMLPKGKECIEVMDRTILDNEERFVRGFTKEEKEQFAAYLTRAIRNMGQRAEPFPHKEDNF